MYKLKQYSICVVICLYPLKKKKYKIKYHLLSFYYICIHIAPETVGGVSYVPGLCIITSTLFKAKSEKGWMINFPGPKLDHHEEKPKINVSQVILD